MSKRDIEYRLLQSPEWERFLCLCNKETFRVNESLFVIEALPFIGKYAYCPRGPILNTKQKMRETIEKAKEKQCSWIRIEPNTKKELEEMQEFFAEDSSFIKHSPKNIQPREILVMDISRNEEELLLTMKSKTRYNIRLAEKRGVEVIVSREKKYQEKFFELVVETAHRAGIRPHPKEHYEKLFETFGDDMLSLYVAQYRNEIIAINMMIVYEDFAIYLHGGSSNMYRNTMAPLLLQWRAIQDAKKRGCQWYNFGGVETMQKEKKHWQGITKFKTGFCPDTEAIHFPGTYDIILKSWKYRLYRWMHFAKNLL